jgi:hypothetical protein
MSNNNLEDKLTGINRAEGYTYEIQIKVNNAVVGTILPGQQRLDIKVTEDMSGEFSIEIVPIKDEVQLSSIKYTGSNNDFSLKILNGTTEEEDNEGVTHNNSDHDTVIPNVPVAPVITSQLNETDVQLSWEAVEDAESYTVKRGEKTGNYTTLAMVLSPGYLDTTRVANTTYYYVVTANNETGSSPNSNEVVYKTIPQAPKLFGSIDGTTGNINWSSANGANYYTLYRSTVEGGPYYAIVENTVNNSYQDTGLKEGTTYYYVIKAINELGESEYSNELEIGSNVATNYTFNPSIDEDEDGLNNDEELLYGTRIYDDDTDNDGMLDGMEVQYGTNPLNADTDGDGIYDGAEQVLGTDPLVANSDSSATKEAQTQSGNIKVIASGNGNLVIAPLQVEEVENVLLESLVGTVGKPIDISSGGYDIDSATISFTYDEADLDGIDENDLTIFLG